MTAKEYLSQVIKLKKKAESLARQIIELRVKAEGVSAIVYDRDKVQTSAADRMPDNVGALVEVKEEYDRTITECLRYIRECEDRISALQSVKQADILRWKYIEDNNGRPYCFSEIAEKWDVSTKAVKRLHDRAINNFEKKWHMFL